MSAVAEKDPHGRQPHEPGAKLDAGKAPVLRGTIQYFPRAMQAVAHVSQCGAEKYAWNGWEHVPNGYIRYGDALGRHLAEEAIDGPYDPATGLLHAAHAAWNALARLELLLRNLDPDPANTCTHCLASIQHFDPDGNCPVCRHQPSTTSVATDCFS